MNQVSMFNTVLVHVSRTWERARLQQESEEMPMDNIESVDEIVSIADQIMTDQYIQEFLILSLLPNPAPYSFMEKTGMMFDSYVESIADQKIKELIS